MTRLHGITLLTALLCASATPAVADFCPSPPGNAWPTGAAQYQCSSSQLPCTPATASTDCLSGETCNVSMNATYDDGLASKWCGTFHSLWNGLHIDSSDWDEGHGATNSGNGWHPTCSPNHFLTRLFNAGYLIQEVTDHAIPYGFNRWLDDEDDDLSGADIDGNNRFRGNWWSFVINHEPDEWVPGCGNSGTLATNVTGIDDYIELHKLSAYRNTALDRSSTIVHETAHEDVGHLDDEDCSAGGSCDDRFGRYNAQTMQIDYLYDAATTYQTQMLGNVRVRNATNYVDPDTGIRMCKYIPVFSDYERDNALSKANAKFDNNFQGSPLRSLTKYDDAEAADLARNPVWECDLCQVSQWNFDPDQCVQTACNELLSYNNQAANSNNWLECLAYNTDVISGGYSEEAIAQAAADHQPQGCFPPEENAVRAFCDAEKASATHVNEIDSCGWLEGVYFPTVSKSICVQEFCRERFVADGGAGWSVAGGDPYGCLDAICAPDGESCFNDLPEAQCRLLFIAAHGHPAYYSASCTADGCQRARSECVADLLVQDPTAWEYPQPVPQQCDLIYDLCRLGEWASAQVFVSLQDVALNGRIIGTGPVEQTINPGFFLESMLLEYQAMLYSGAAPEEMQTLLRSLWMQPEMVRALFELAPGRFVALFGNEGFEELIGPAIHDVVPQPIAMSDLSPEGQQALMQLEELIASTPPEELVSPFGSLRSQLDQLPDGDGDGVPDADDTCPSWPDRVQVDTDRNGIGDACECGDQNLDGTVDVRDVLAINSAIFSPALASPLCDTNFDGACNVADILGANAKIFGAPAYCEQYPPPTR